MVERTGLGPHIRYGAEVAEAAWDDDHRLWRVRLVSGEQLTARVLVSAWGQLNRPSTKGIPGVESFAGDWFHSARWDHGVPMAGRRIAAVGNGPSAVQFIPELAKVAGRLLVFQRSPSYVVPRLDRPLEPEERQAYQAEPERVRENRAAIFAEHETWYGAMRQGTERAAEFEAAARMQLDTQVHDPALRGRLWPSYPFGCKRLCISDDFYPAFNRPNVELVTEAIAQVEPGGIRATDGVLHGVDVIVYGTGFETLSFLGPVEIYGRHGQSLREAWHDGPRAHLGMTVPGFPNLFYLYGPNTNLGHNSILLMLEAQAGYIAQALRVMRERGGAPVEVRADAAERFDAELRAALKDSAWAAGCVSWYKTADGRITNNWWGSAEDYQRATARFDPAEYQALEAASAE